GDVLLVEKEAHFALEAALLGFAERSIVRDLLLEDVPPRLGERLTGQPASSPIATRPHRINDERDEKPERTPADASTRKPDECTGHPADQERSHERQQRDARRQSI